MSAKHNPDFLKEMQTGIRALQRRGRTPTDASVNTPVDTPQVMTAARVATRVDAPQVMTPVCVATPVDAKPVEKGVSAVKRSTPKSEISAASMEAISSMQAFSMSVASDLSALRKQVSSESIERMMDAYFEKKMQAFMEPVMKRLEVCESGIDTMNKTRADEIERIVDTRVQDQFSSMKSNFSTGLTDSLHEKLNSFELAVDELKQEQKTNFSRIQADLEASIQEKVKKNHDETFEEACKEFIDTLVECNEERSRTSMFSSAIANLRLQYDKLVQETDRGIKTMMSDLRDNVDKSKKTVIELQGMKTRFDENLKSCNDAANTFWEEEGLRMDNINNQHREKTTAMLSSFQDDLNDLRTELSTQITDEMHQVGEQLSRLVSEAAISSVEDLERVRKDLNYLADNPLSLCKLYSDLGCDNFKVLFSFIKKSGLFSAMNLVRIFDQKIDHLPDYSEEFHNDLINGKGGKDETTENILAGFPRDQTLDQLFGTFKGSQLGNNTTTFYEHVVMLAPHLKEVFFK